MVAGPEGPTPDSTTIGHGTSVGSHEELFLEPTVLRDATDGMAVSCNEHSGPIAPVIPSADDEEAVGLANDTGYRPTGTVFSTDLERAERVADRVAAGIVRVDERPINDEPHIPSAA